MKKTLTALTMCLLLSGTVATAATVSASTEGQVVSQALFSLMFTVRMVYEVKSQSIRTPINFSVTAVDCIQSRFTNRSFACVTSRGLIL